MFSVKTERSNVVIAEVSDGLQAMPQVQVCGNTCAHWTRVLECYVKTHLIKGVIYAEFAQKDLFQNTLFQARCVVW